MAPDRHAAGGIGLLIALTLLAGGCASVRERAPEGWSLGALLGPMRRPDPGAVGRPSDLVPPESLRVTSAEDRQISLAWNPVLVGDVAGYAITRSDSTQGPYSTVGRTNSRFGTVFTDEGEGPGALGDGQTYFYRIHPFDSQLRLSRSHAFVSATTDPPPEVPSGLQVYSNLPRRVVLTWEPSDQWTVWGYGAYRAPTMAGPWEPVATVPGRLDAVYEDQVPGDLRVMYYRITARNRYGGESEMTDAVRAVTKAEPLPPIDLRVSDRHLGRIELSWAPNVERDLVAYEVWRARKDGGTWEEPQRLARVAAGSTDYADTSVLCGEPLRYQLRAIDADGLVSDHSTALEVRAQDLGLTVVSREDGGWRLRWNVDQTRGWTSARITHARWGLPDRVLADVGDTGSFDLPDLGRRSRLRISLSRATPEGKTPAATTTAAPSCEIELPGEGSALLNPPAAPLD